jgi:uncharacterized integral membrane protein
MAADTSRLRFGDMIAGGGAIALFLFMLLPWYKAEVSGPGGLDDSESKNAWGALGGGDLLLFLLLAIVIAAVVLRLLGMEAQIPVPLGTVIAVAGALATLYILFRIANLPGEIGEAKDRIDDLKDLGTGVDASVGRSFGIFLSFLAALAMTAGGVLSMRERGEAIPGVDGPMGSGTGGGPLGGGQPAAGGPLGGGHQAGSHQAGAQTAVADPGAQAGGQPKADWYPDPQGQARLRYWDGAQWTDQTAD